MISSTLLHSLEFNNVWLVWTWKWSDSLMAFLTTVRIIGQFSWKNNMISFSFFMRPPLFEILNRIYLTQYTGDLTTTSADSNCWPFFSTSLEGDLSCGGKLAQWVNPLLPNSTRFRDYSTRKGIFKEHKHKHYVQKRHTHTHTHTHIMVMYEHRNLD